MLQRQLVLAIGAATLVVGATPMVVPVAGADADTPGLVAVYPNPVAHGDAGEFVAVSVPPETDLSRYALTDGETAVDLPAVAGNRTVAFSTAANRTTSLLDRPVRQLPGRLELANGGETVELVRGNRTVDAISFADAPEGTVRQRDTENRRWRPLGATDRPVVTAGGGTVESFVLPDAAGRPAETIADADERVLLAGYTVTSRRVASILRSAHRRNVTVRVLIEGGPVGGVDRRQVRLLDGLVDAGVEVRVIGGDLARYRYHHAKYAVVDDRAVVTTENWKPAGTGGRASRGWGVVTNQTAIVAGLADTFRADAGWHNAVPWERYRDGVNATESEPATGTFPRSIPPERVPVERTELLVAPENAADRVAAAIDSAEDSLWIEQASLGGVRQPLVRASVDAARRGVSVRILLGNAWYNREDNRAVVDRLETIAEREDLDLQARLVEPRGRFDRLHAKGAVIDGEHVVVGSMNWNNNSARNNREVVLALRGDEIGAYYQNVVRTDWRGGTWRVSVGLVAVVILATLGAWIAGRRIRFESRARTRRMPRR